MTMKRILSIALALMACTAMYAYTSPYNNLGTALNKPFKVNGGAGIVQFAKAFAKVLPIDMETAEIDRKGGYISYFEEGDGSYNVNMCIWNRTDGKKLFVVSYRIFETVSAGSTAGTCSKYHYSALGKGFTPEFASLTNSGFRSYLYNAQTATLEPMAVFPVDELPRTGAEHESYFLNLPQKGKDILLTLGNDIDNTSYHNLVWNGKGWTLTQGPSASVYVIDSTPANVRNAPKGEIVATLNNGDMIQVDRCINGWFHIVGNDYQTGDGEEAVFKTTADKWIHRSTIGSNWRGGDKLLYSGPNDISNVVANISTIDDDNEIKEILDLRNGMIKVRTINGKVGWCNVDNLCGNSLTTCP